MDIYGVPEEYHEALGRLVALTDSQVANLCAALGRLPLRLFPGEEVAKEISDVLSVSQKDAQQLAEVLLSLYFRLAKSSQDVTTAATSVIASIPSTRPEDAAAETKARRIANLTRLLSIESLYVQQNATGLLYERQNLYSDARVLTDLRPVFPRETQVTHGPSAFLVAHTLRVSYEGVAGPEEIFLAMDARDLQQLIDLLERALAKERILLSVIKKTEIPIIEPRG